MTLTSQSIPHSRQEALMFAFETDLDALSNKARDAIKARKYDEAERRCQKLLREYPEVLDGHWCSAELREAQGRFQEAAEHFTKTLEMIAQTPEAFGKRLVQNLTARRDQVLAKTKP
jgi:tetratricopeptide (TPR) repeat protein